MSRVSKTSVNRLTRRSAGDARPVPEAKSQYTTRLRKQAQPVPLTNIAVRRSGPIKALKKCVRSFGWSEILGDALACVLSVAWEYERGMIGKQLARRLDNVSDDRNGRDHFGQIAWAEPLLHPFRRSGMGRMTVIAVSSFAMRGDEEKARAAGCDGYVTKPYSPKQLVDLVRRFLAKAWRPSWTADLLLLPIGRLVWAGERQQWQPG
jgi:CheY-like chemotaxis protein